MKNKSILTSLFTAAMAIACGTLPMPALSENYVELQNRILYHDVIVSSDFVNVPIGYWLLVHKDKTSCAIRFTDFKVVRSAGYASFSEPISNSENNIHGDGRIYVEYDFFNQSDGSGDFKKSNVGIGHNKVTRTIENWESLGDLVGCGSLILQISSFGKAVAFNLAEPLGENAELAPTQWRNASEINIKDPRITWYRYDKARKVSQIPIEDLW